MIAAAAACDGHAGPDAGTGTVSQAVAPTAPVPPKKLGVTTATDYLQQCGLGGTGGGADDLKLPEIGTASAPIRGSTDPKAVGTTSNSWTLIQHFDSQPTQLAVSSGMKANLWQKKAGGRVWYYLYRYSNADGTQAQQNANGVLGFADASICALDKLIGFALPGGTVAQPIDKPPAALTDLLFAGQNNTNLAQLDDCSDCHIEGFLAPRQSTLAIAHGPGGALKNLTEKWRPRWNAFASAYGPEWWVGNDPSKAFAGTWISGIGTKLVDSPKSCSGCHATWIPVRNTTRYCPVFASAFSTTAMGSMTEEENKFATNAICTAFATAIGCATAFMCPPDPPGLAANAPLVTDGRIVHASSATGPSTVTIVPQQNASVPWTVGLEAAIGNQWAVTIQVWGSPVPGTLAALTSPIAVTSVDALPSIPLGGLTPGTTYQFQLMIVDADGEVSLDPVTQVTTPCAGCGSDAGVPDAGPPIDAGAGSGSGFIDAGAPPIDAGAGSGFIDAGAPPHDAGAGSG